MVNFLETAHSQQDESRELGETPSQYHPWFLSLRN